MDRDIAVEMIAQQRFAPVIPAHHKLPMDNSSIRNMQLQEAMRRQLNMNNEYPYAGYPPYGGAGYHPIPRPLALQPPGFIPAPMPQRAVREPEPTEPDNPVLKLSDENLWQKFHKLTTEMVITKSGR